MIADTTTSPPPSSAARPWQRHDTIRWPQRHHWPARIAALVPLLDLGGLLLVAMFLGLWSVAPLADLAARSGLSLAQGSSAAIVAALSALIAPVLLHDRRFGEQVWRSQWRRLAQTHAWRGLLVAAAIGWLAWRSRQLDLGAPADADAAASSWMTTAALALLVVMLLTSLTRVIAAWSVLRLRSQGRLTEVVAVVGDGPLAHRFVAELARAPAGSVELLGVFDEAPHGQRLGPVASIAALAAIAARRRIDWIVLALPDARAPRRQRLLRQLGTLGIPMGHCAPHLGLGDPRLADARTGEHLPLGLLIERPICRWQAVFKAATDRVLAGLLLLLLAPLLVAIAAAIRLDSRGPLLFRQRRHALDNREFDILKFRTMHWAPRDDTAPLPPLQQTCRNDARITAVGRVLRATSLDELPQLFNVLAGTMSLVGPRPHAVDMRTQEHLGADIVARYAHRHRVKPGITGWAQVNGARGATDTAAQLRRRVELDLHYIAHWSPLLDLQILLRTAGVVMRRTNAY